MRKLKIIIPVMLLLTSLFVFAGYPPSNVRTAFGKIYPKTTDVVWSQQGNYYVANFIMDGFNKDVWFNASARWIMTLIDLVTTDELTPAVYNAYAMGPYSSWQVKNVTQASFPKCPTTIVIKVGQQNINTQYQLFYSTDGGLMRAYNMGYTESTLTPATFGCE